MSASGARSGRDAWVSYLRVGTPEQADSELSLLAQRRSIEAYARQHDRTIVREYVGAGCSGTSMNRKAFRAMLQDVLRADSDVGTILVHHTSRFSRDATEARVLKKTLRKKGVRVISVCQHMDDGPFGNLVRRHPSECLPLRVEPIVDMDLYERARRLRDGRAPGRLPGRPLSPTTLLS